MEQPGDMEDMAADVYFGRPRVPFEACSFPNVFFTIGPAEWRYLLHLPMFSKYRGNALPWPRCAGFARAWRSFARLRT